MKKSILLFTMILSAIFFTSCKGNQKLDNKDFSLIGLQFTIYTDNGKNSFPLYKDSSLRMHFENNTWYLDYNEPIEYLDDGMKCKILDYDYEYNSAYVKGKKTEGWVPVAHCDVKFDKKIFLAGIKPALEGNKDAEVMLDFNFTELTLKESMTNFQYIMEYVGSERLKNLHIAHHEDAVVLTLFERLIQLAPQPNFGDNVTNPLHLLSEFANENTWKFLDTGVSLNFTHYNCLSEFYDNAFFDSDGVSAQMHAVKAGNLAALKYFYEHEIPNNYFAKMADVDKSDKENIFPLIMSTKDSNQKSLADYIAECNDQDIKNLMQVYDLKSNLSEEDCLKYLYKIKENVQSPEEKVLEYGGQWLYQADFINNNVTVIREIKLLNPNGKEVTVKPGEKVEILSKLDGNYGEDLWDYGNQDFSNSHKYFFRYNYYLVRTDNYKTGIIGGSSLVHSIFFHSYDGPEANGEGRDICPYYFSYRLLYNPNRDENHATSYFAEIYEGNHETNEVYYLETGYSDGPSFKKEPAYLGEISEDFRYEMEIVAYRDFEMARKSCFDEEPFETESFYTFIFKTPLNYPQVSYNCYTVNLNTRQAYKSFYKTANDMEGKSEDNFYSNSYSYFESENKKIPQCVFGKMEVYGDGENSICLTHHIEHLKLDPQYLVMMTVGEEDLDYTPEF